MNYAESDPEEEEDDILDPSVGKSRRGRAAKRRKIESEDDDDIFDVEDAVESDILDEGLSTLATGLGVS